MPRFSANLAYLFAELPFMERFAAAASAGFKAVEIQFPYHFPAPEIRRELDRHGLTLDLINMPAGDWAGGERGLAALPGREEEFSAAVELALEYAEALNVRKINCLSGLDPAAGLSAGGQSRPLAPGEPRAEVDKAGQEAEEETFHRVAGRLALAADRLAASGRLLLAEGINGFDMPGFWLDGPEKFRRMQDALKRPNLFYQFDIYHAARMGLDIPRAIRENFARIGHFQLADAPGRNQPGLGQIPFAELFRLIDGLGYSGYIGLEYAPLPDSRASLGWIAQLGCAL
ncbi:TIM barrel protein [Desulfovibrio sp. OttesenSCG-928-C14]|nr:TIM barrel protein [Desulfovibrio sp. OttesenSCG-928-C14]